MGSLFKKKPEVVREGNRSSIATSAGVVAARCPSPDFAEYLLNHVCKIVDRQRSLSDGEKFTLGWTTYRVQTDTGGFLIHQPDYERDATTDYTPELDSSVAIYVQQMALVHKLGTSDSFCTYQHHISVEPRAFEAELVALQRVTPAQGVASGWYLRPADMAPDDIEDAHAHVAGLPTMPGHELFKKRAALINPLLLPEGFGVVLAGDALVTAINGNTGQEWSLAD